MRLVISILALIGAIFITPAFAASDHAGRRVHISLSAARHCKAIHGHSAYCHARENRHAIMVVSAQVYKQETRAQVKHWHQPRLSWNLLRLERQNRHWRDRLVHVSRMPTYIPQPSNPVMAIRVVFGPTAGAALTVARCESGYSTSAVNGQYLGLFQMGSSERAHYATEGYSTAWQQARAAWRYSSGGRNWGPWQCSPGGGLQW